MSTVVGFEVGSDQKEGMTVGEDRSGERESSTASYWMRLDASMTAG